MWAPSAPLAASVLQQGKHITTGEGGLVTTNDDALARRMFLFINKAWGYGDANPDHYFLALNYRMSELQGAVAVAQLPKLPGVAEARIAAAEKIVRQTQEPSRNRDALGGSRKQTHLLEILPARGWPASSGRGGGPGAGIEDAANLLRAALHPEARVYVPDFPRAAHFRQEPLSFYLGPARGIELRSGKFSSDLGGSRERSSAALERKLHR